MFAEIRKEVLNTDRPCALPLVVCGIGSSPHQPPVARPSGFGYHHLLWVTAGEGLFCAGGQQMTLSAGEGLFCRRNVPHGYEQAGALFSTSWLTFLGAENLLDYYHVGDYLRFEAPEFLCSSLDSLWKFCESSSTVVSRSAAGYTWLTELLEALFAPESPAEAVRQYLESHYAQPLSLDEISAQVHMSRYALCHYYMRTQGMTVMEQLKRIRVAKAKQFLRYTVCPVSEVGQMCGYDSASYFGKQFREETGHSPGAYRALHSH